MVYNNSKKGAQGIGTLIIFIALILVAAVAAGVLIQTASSLQSKSLDVGRQSQEKITTDIEVVQVFTNDTSDSIINDSIDSVTILVRLGSGSSPIKLDDMIIKFDTQSYSQTVTRGTAGVSNYGVRYVING
ncbi:MAG: flagellin, partial [Nanoarchaeota archaeon]|nr:flagellin [Nanoarchaeota archaeon]